MVEEHESLSLVARTPGQPDVRVAMDVAQSIKKKLAAKTPSQYVRRRQGPANKIFSYAPWSYYARVLNNTFGPAWSMTFRAEDIMRIPLPKEKNSTKDREEIVVTVTLKTPFGTQTASGSDIYYVGNAEPGLGSVIQSAASTALKRATARIGPGLDLYANDGDDILPDIDVPEVSAWKDACARYGFTEGNAIALLSETLTGDQNSLRTMADLVDAVGSPAAVVVALDDAVAAMTQQPEKVEDAPLPKARAKAKRTPPRRKAR